MSMDTEGRAGGGVESGGGVEVRSSIEPFSVSVGSVSTQMNIVIYILPGSGGRLADVQMLTPGCGLEPNYTHKPCVCISGALLGSSPELGNILAGYAVVTYSIALYFPSVPSTFHWAQCWVFSAWHGSARKYNTCFNQPFEEHIASFLTLALGAADHIFGECTDKWPYSI